MASASAGDGASRAVRVGGAVLRRADRALRGAFPLWLAPVQVGLVPISEKHLEYAEK
jgi:threonyl-tRNA synthetase